MDASTRVPMRESEGEDDERAEDLGGRVFWVGVCSSWRTWKAPEMAKASSPASCADQPRRSSGAKTVRRKRPWISRFHRRDQKSEMQTDSVSGERNIVRGARPTLARARAKVEVRRRRKR